MSQEQIHEVELSIEAAKKMVRFGQQIERMTNNRDFKAVVLDGYFKDEAQRLAHLYSDPDAPEEVREKAASAMMGMGAFRSWLNYRNQMAANAARAIEEDQETLDELRAEADGVDGDDDGYSEAGA